MVEYDIRRYEPRDEAAALDTFNLVFGQGDPDFEPRTVDEWRWVYDRNPAGTRLWVAMAGETCAAAYASQPNRVLDDGEEVIFCQIIDSMSHPEHRRGLKRPGLFIEVARRMLEDFVSDPVVFGLPNVPAWRMGKTFLRYEFVRWQTFVAREIGAGETELPDGVVPLERFEEDVRTLYDRCRAPWRASVMRDAAYLNWRFVDHPRNRYEILGVPDGSGGLRGYAIYRSGDWPVAGSGLVADWLVPEDDVEAGALLERALVARARAHGVPHLIAIFPEWSPWFARFQLQGWTVHPSDYLMSGRWTHPKYDMHYLRDHWWYTLAEVDLV